jgi:hypothetical protein
MKVIYFFAIIGLGFSCQPTKSAQSEILGNWVFYDSELYYLEIYINDSNIFVYENGGMYTAPEYELSNDSIFTFDRESTMHPIGNRNANGYFQFEYMDGIIIELSSRLMFESKEYSLEILIEGKAEMNEDKILELYKRDRNNRETEFMKKMLTPEQFDFWINPPDSVKVFFDEIEPILTH